MLSEHFILSVGECVCVCVCVCGFRKCNSYLCTYIYLFTIRWMGLHEGLELFSKFSTWVGSHQTPPHQTSAWVYVCVCRGDVHVGVCIYAYVWVWVCASGGWVQVSGVYKWCVCVCVCVCVQVGDECKSVVCTSGVCVCVCVCKWGVMCSLVSRPSTPPVFDHLQYCWLSWPCKFKAESAVTWWVSN